MAVKLFDLYGDVSLKTENVKRSLDDLKKRVDEAQKRFADFGKALSDFGRAATTRLTVPLAAIGTVLVKLGSDSQEVRAKFETAFGGIEERADAVAAALAEGYGLSQTAAERLLSSTGDLLKGFGATADQALGLSNDVQELAVDLASYNNLQGGASRASEILTKAMLGERDALTSLGIKIAETDVQQRLLEKGQSELTGQALLLAKAQATLELAYQQSGDAQGDFARTQDSFANQWRQLRADAEDLAVSFREQVLPAATQVIGSVRQLVQWFTNLSDGTKQTIVRVAALAAAVGPLAFVFGKLFTLYSTIRPILLAVNAALAGQAVATNAGTAAKIAHTVATKAAAAAQALLNAVMAANPITGLVVVLGALAAVLGGKFLANQIKARRAQEQLNGQMTDGTGATGDLADETERLAAAQERINRYTQLANQQIDRIRANSTSWEDELTSLNGELYLAEILLNRYREAINEGLYKNERGERYDELLHDQERAVAALRQRIQEVQETISGNDAETTDPVEERYAEIIAELNANLAEAERSARAFGEEFDLATAQAQAYKQAIEEIVEDPRMRLDAEGIQGLIATYEELMAGIRAAAEESERLARQQEVLQRLDADMDHLADRAAVFGDEVDELSEQTKLYQSAIEDLLAAGFDPYSSEVQELTAELERLRAEQEEQQRLADAEAERLAKLAELRQAEKDQIRENAAERARIEQQIQDDLARQAEQAAEQRIQLLRAERAEAVQAAYDAGEDYLAVQDQYNEQILALELAALEEQQRERIAEAQAAGADITGIDRYFANERARIEEALAAERAQIIESFEAEVGDTADQTLSDRLAALEERYRVFGDEIDLTAEKTRLYREEILRLLGEGHDAESDLVQELIGEYQGLLDERNKQIAAVEHQENAEQRKAEAERQRAEEARRRAEEERRREEDQLRLEEEHARTRSEFFRQRMDETDQRILAIIEERDEYIAAGIDIVEAEQWAQGEIRKVREAEADRARQELQSYAQDVSNATFSVASAWAQMLAAVSDLTAQATDEQIAAIDAETERLKEAARERFETEEEYQEYVEDLEEDAAARKAEHARKQLRMEKAAALFRIGVDTAAAIVKFLIDPGGLLGISLSAFAGLTGALQAAKVVNKQIPAFAEGGIVPGTSYTGDRVAARVNSGEMILTRDMQMNLLRMVSERQPVANRQTVNNTTTNAPQITFSSMFDLSSPATKRRAARELMPYILEEQARRGA